MNDLTNQDQFAIGVTRKVTRRLIPLLILLYVMAHLDRINVSIAALTMNEDLGFSERVYGIGAGIFFFGYFFFQVPSNILLEKFGAKRLIFTIMLIWGSISAAMALVQTAEQFIVMRFMLGVAESGLYPGIILYITYWFRERDRATAVAQFALALTVAGAFGGPLSGWILDVAVGWAGLASWQWLFIIEGLPTIFIGFLVLFVMTDKPTHAKWLTDAERQWLIDELEKEQRATGSRETNDEKEGFLRQLLDTRVVCLSLLYFLFLGSFTGVVLWAPKILQFLDGGLSNGAIGWLSGLPYVPFAIAMIWWGKHSDRTAERQYHVTAALVVSVVGSVICANSETVLLFMIGALVVMTGLGAGLGTFWGLVTSTLSAKRTAVGIAAVNSLGALGAFSATVVVGDLFARFGDYYFALLTMALFGIVATLLAGLFPWAKKTDQGVVEG